MLREGGFRKLALILLTLILVAAWVQQLAFDLSLHRRMRDAAASAGQLAAPPATGSGIILQPTGETVTEEEMTSILDRTGAGARDSFTLWTFRGHKGASATAMGTDRRHHFVNSFLVGYRPFRVDHPWIPLYALAMRLRYQLDAEQYAGLEDVWQTSRQAFINTRGDCEDHALLLADWLISCGFQARVVVGSIPTGGHAWVVVFLDGKAFLLEATSKRKRRKWRHYPLASLVTDYRPSLMFDRETFWMTTHASVPERYSGPNWEERSRFYPGSGPM